MRMKPMCRMLVASLTLLILSIPAGVWSGNDDITGHPHCSICGMDRHQFAHSRMLIHYEDGSQFGACSLHCAALELAYRPGKLPTGIEVADYGTRQLVDAESAVWVIGGSKMGVMTANAKWAFADEKAATSFIDQYGGRQAVFEDAISTAFADMYADTKMIREKRKKMKHMKKGHPKKGHMSHDAHQHND